MVWLPRKQSFDVIREDLQDAISWRQVCQLASPEEIQLKATLPRFFLPLSAPSQNGALVALSKHCPGLVSLNVALVGRVTDVGVSTLSRGCRSLQALNIAGAKEVRASC